MVNKRQKEVLQYSLDEEIKAIAKLGDIYAQALSDIDHRLEKLYQRFDPDTGDLMQSAIYQIKYQAMLKEQVSDILDKLNTNQYLLISDFLNDSYLTGFIGDMYDLHGQGIPLTLPIRHEDIVRAVTLDSKISQGLYTRLGQDVEHLKRKIATEMTRGISQSRNWKSIAQQLARHSNIGYNNSVRITRTEGHRIQVSGAMDAMHQAKEHGADIVKQWDAALDKRTRHSHREVDGEIRELDEPFSNGLMFPGDPNGPAKEVIHCRCACLQRARWALDDGELETLKERAKYYGLDKSNQFDDFRKKYLEATKEESKYTYDSTVVSPFVKTSKYRNIYNHLDEMPKIQRIACERARGMLAHRSGTKYEDLTFINSITGEYITRHDYSVESQVLPSKRMRAMVAANAPYTIISMHNHPGSAVPSEADLRTAYMQKYKYGLIACHNGYVMRYKVIGEYNSLMVNILLDNINRILYNENEIVEKELEAALLQLKEYHVILEVFRSDL